MPELETVETKEDSAREGRFSGWRFWLVAFLLHALFLVMLTQIGWVTRVGRALIALPDDMPKGVPLDVAIPGAPPGPGLAGPPTPGVKIPLVGMPDAKTQMADAQKPQVNLISLQSIIAATQASSWSIAGQQPVETPGAIDGLSGQGMPFGQGGTGNVPAAWGKRFERDKKLLVPDAQIEEAVLSALRWLKKNQNADGTWGSTYAVGMTGLALLTFLAHGETPTSREFGEAVRNGINYLLPLAEKGKFSNIAGSNDAAYEHGIATYALAEAYGITKDPRLRAPLEKCIQIIIDGQTTGGGWIYRFNTNDEYGDMSISSWQIQALKAAYLAGVMTEKISPCLDKAMTYAKSVYDPTWQGFGYRSPKSTGAWLSGEEDPKKIMSLTGTGILCLQFWKNGGAIEAQSAISYLNAFLKFNPAGSDGQIDAYKIYGYYYATQALFLADGPDGKIWTHWDSLYRKPLMALQKEDGSFPAAPVGAAADNLVFSTALSALMLEVWYRTDASGLNITVLKLE